MHSSPSTTYRAVHQRLHKARGHARQHPCAWPGGCDRTAHAWAWDHTGDVLTETMLSFGTERTLSYTLDLDRYLPLCRSHHISFDAVADPDFFPCGHPRSEENTYRRPNGNGYCRTCHRDQERARNGRAGPGRTA